MRLPSYKRHRFPPEIIAHAVWRSFRFALRWREVEEMLAERGVIVTYETVRQWCRPRPGDTWHQDAVLIVINGVTHYLWRAVAQDGNILHILVQARRDAAAACTFFRTRLKRLRYVPRVVITGKLASDGAARREVLPSVEHRRHTGLNNRAEHAHQPTRERERRMRRCKSPGHAQRFRAADGPIASSFRQRRQRLTAAADRHARNARFATWRAVTGTPAMARAPLLPSCSTPMCLGTLASPTFMDNSLRKGRTIE